MSGRARKVLELRLLTEPESVPRSHQAVWDRGTLTRVNRFLRTEHRCVRETTGGFARQPGSIRTLPNSSIGEADQTLGRVEPGESNCELPDQEIGGLAQAWQLFWEEHRP